MLNSSETPQEQPVEDDTAQAIQESPVEEPVFVDQAPQETGPQWSASHPPDWDWVYRALLIVVLLAGAYFRLVGMNWDEGTYIHPDERFLIMVGSALSPLTCQNPDLSIENCPSDQRKWLGVGDYFKTAKSNLNPYNRGFGFYVYGTFPVILVRYAAEFLEKTGYGSLHLVGRPASALADMGVIILVYLAAAALYNRRVGLVAAAFSALAVMQIQQSHFFTVDNFVNLFTWFAIYMAIKIGVRRFVPVSSAREDGGSVTGLLLEIWRHPLLQLAFWFGVALGLAVAAKISAAPLAFILPAAVSVYFASVPPSRRERELVVVFGVMALAALGSLVSFRVFQPYAFQGPGFFDVGLNPQWMDNIRSLSNQVKPDSGFPPSVQWYDRPIWFSGQNLTFWGVGLPAALIAWTGFILMAFKTFTGQWRKHLLVWGWTALYFAWQSSLWNPTMRYQLPVYPGLAIIAGWVLVEAWDWGKKAYRSGGGAQGSLTRLAGRVPLHTAAALLGVLALAATAAYAYGFTRIYVREITRIESSRWIYQSIPGPLNLKITTGAPEGVEQVFSQPVPLPYGNQVRSGSPFIAVLYPQKTGQLNEIVVGRAASLAAGSQQMTLMLSVYDSPDQEELLARSFLIKDFAEPSLNTFNLDVPLAVEQGMSYTFALEPVDVGVDLNFCLTFRLAYSTPVGLVEQDLPVTDNCIYRPSEPFLQTFVAQHTGDLYTITMPQVQVVPRSLGPHTLRLEVLSQHSELEILAQGTVDLNLGPAANLFALNQVIKLEPPLQVQEGQGVTVKLTLVQGDGPITLLGAAIANETSWDDGQPMRIDGYDGFGGIYQGGLNFEMYWPDNAEKRQRFIANLDQADVIMVTSSRQWGSLTRLPEKYPLVVTYYRNLLGCPEERTIEWCFNVAEVGTFQGKLGYELVRVFSSEPSIGNITLNSQFAEEAFTVYDHPKVFVFIKTSAYDPNFTQELFNNAPLEGQVGAQGNGKTLLLSPERVAEQTASSTWADLFPRQSILNRSQVVGAVVYYLVFSLMGWVSYPILRIATKGLADRAYPLARTFGMLLLSYLVWLAGSFGVTFNAQTITLAAGLIALLAALAAWFQWEGLRQEWQEKKKYFLTVELLALAAFLFFLLIRLGNPDLWHPWKGGEKPMDFSYFNAVLRSTHFPPYDPWFAGGYINYYYYGFVFVGVLVKWLGLVPSFAYNLVLPALYAMLVLGAFSLGWNLVSAVARAKKPLEGEAETPVEVQAQSPGGFLSTHRLPLVAGVVASLGVAFLGNLGSLKMVLRGYQMLVAEGVPLESVGFFQRALWTFQGFFRVFGGQGMPYSLGDWYWLPSRAIPAPGDVEPITEFPMFTFLYADLHAHMMALPLTLLALTWAFAMLSNRGWEDTRSPIGRFAHIVVSLLVGGLAIGVLRPTNTWDFPTYLALGVLALAYSAWMYFRVLPNGVFSFLRAPYDRAAAAILLPGTLIGLAFVAFQPYANAYALGYTEVQRWQGTVTPLGAYLVHWGLFLFVIASWMAWLTLDWLASTPISAVKKLQPLQGVIYALFLIFAGLVAYGQFSGVSITWLVLLLAAWAAVLLLRPGLPDAHRFVLFLVGTGLFLTLMVEFIVLSGDIGRMNTVFKFYLQVWVLFGISAAAMLTWLLSRIEDWPSVLRRYWLSGLVVLVFIAALFPLLGGSAKIRDRMAANVPVSLDGMTYMPLSTYGEQGRTLTLDEDYRAILWMQDHIQGTPVILEANTVEYRWGSRYTINTGLPGVVGWNWHQRQQRGVVSTDQVTSRVGDIDMFYRTANETFLKYFLDNYPVEYIVVGQLERAYYEGSGIDKFEIYTGYFWNLVYRDGQTSIYQVIREPVLKEN